MSENVSAETEWAVTEKNASIFHGEINKPSGIEFPQTKGRSFQENCFHIYNWLHCDQEKDAAFCYVYVQAIESEILVNLSNDHAFVTKKQNQSDSHKSAVERQITLASKGYGKNSVEVFRKWIEKKPRDKIDISR